jgi:hypothetical protein
MRSRGELGPEYPMSRAQTLVIKWSLALTAVGLFEALTSLAYAG